MSQLIHLRQRIKAIETIKKITHAMRLISMSTHAQLKHRSPFVQFYASAIQSLFATLYTQSSTSKKETSTNVSERYLVIFIGSQKGLCGTFNTQLSRCLFECLLDKKAELVVVGKKVLEYAEQQSDHSIMQVYTTLSMRTLLTISQEITNLILQQREQYTHIILASNMPKTFFVQQPRLFTLFPLTEQEALSKNDDTLHDYLWEQKQEDLLPILLHQYIASEVYNALFQSLIAEQASRFISMDSSTRNAKELLDIARLHYNKLRQAIITKELTELSSSY